jgi:hypothetical protein
MYADRVVVTLRERKCDDIPILSHFNPFHNILTLHFFKGYFVIFAIYACAYRLQLAEIWML